MLIPESEAATEPDLEPELIELLELLPETVAEDQHQPEKLSPADLIDRFIMISPNIVEDVTEGLPDHAGSLGRGL